MIKKTISILMSMALAIGSLAPMSAYATEADEPEPEGEIREYVPGETEKYELDWGDSDELFEEYAKKRFYDSDTPKLRGSKKTGDNLTGQNKVIYDRVRAAAEQIAAGERESTLVKIPYKELGLDLEGTLYAEDLGLSYIYDHETGTWNDEIRAAVNGLFDYDMWEIQNCLFADCPYEFYWAHALLSGGHNYYMSATYDSETGEYVGYLEFADTELFIYILTSSSYADPSDPYGYTVDVSKTGAAASAAEYAKTVVQGASAYETDYDKLNYFKETICGLVEYNDDAAASGGAYADTNPWTLIYVFDQDPGTNVVCEGYSEAFQYLCDQADFVDDSVCAYSVTGGNYDKSGNGGGHKWNIVHMEDGRNYLADITNSDEGAWGYAGELFLKGAEGSVEEGYKVYDPYNNYLNYVYDEGTRAIFSDEELTLSAEAYLEEVVPPDPPVHPAGWCKEESGWMYWNEDDTFVTGWLYDGGKWYYMDRDGIMATGWQKISGVWYYLTGSGAMATGWQKISGVWYYFAGSGAMATGWQKIGGAWYYFAGSGAMVTGWQQIGGVWYYFAGSGAMVTGWQKIGGKWYYFESGGAMAKNKWVGDYYLTGSGAMAVNTWIGKYYVGSDGKWVR